jgi:hypothetical protein
MPFKKIISAAFIVAATLLAVVVVGGHGGAVRADPKGAYCLSYFFGVVRGKATIDHPRHKMDLSAKFPGTKIECPAVDYELDMATGNVRVPSMDDASSCIGSQLRRFGVDSLGIKLREDAKAVELKIANLFTFKLKSC